MLKKLLSKIVIVLVVILGYNKCHAKDCSPLTISAAVHGSELILEIELMEYIEATRWSYKMLTTFKGGIAQEGIINLKKNIIFVRKDSLIVFGSYNVIDGVLEPIEHCNFQQIIRTGGDYTADCMPITMMSVLTTREKRPMYHRWIDYCLTAHERNINNFDTLICGVDLNSEKVSFTSISNVKVFRENWQPIFIDISLRDSDNLMISIPHKVSDSLRNSIANYFINSSWCRKSIGQGRIYDSKESYVICLVLSSDALSVYEF